MSVARGASALSRSVRSRLLVSAVGGVCTAVAAGRVYVERQAEPAAGAHRVGVAVRPAPPPLPRRSPPRPKAPPPRRQGLRAPLLRLHQLRGPDRRHDGLRELGTPDCGSCEAIAERHREDLRRRRPHRVRRMETDGRSATVPAQPGLRRSWTSASCMSPEIGGPTCRSNADLVPRWRGSPMTCYLVSVDDWQVERIDAGALDEPLHSRLASVSAAWCVASCMFASAARALPQIRAQASGEAEPTSSASA